MFLARLVLGCVFLASSLPKLRQPYDFLGDVYKYQLTGVAASKFIAMTLPWLELLLGVCLIGAVALGGCFLVGAGLSLIFAFAQASALVRELPIACGCFGSLVATETIGYGSLLRLALMFVVAVLGLVAWRASAMPADEEEARDVSTLAKLA
jgi:putative oxidoreductase